MRGVRGAPGQARGLWYREPVIARADNARTARPRSLPALLHLLADRGAGPSMDPVPSAWRIVRCLRDLRLYPASRAGWASLENTRRDPKRAEPAVPVPAAPESPAGGGENCHVQGLINVRPGDCDPLFCRCELDLTPPRTRGACRRGGVLNVPLRGVVSSASLPIYPAGAARGAGASQRLGGGARLHSRRASAAGLWGRGRMRRPRSGGAGHARPAVAPGGNRSRGPCTACRDAHRVLAEIYAVLAGIAGTRPFTPEERRIIEICESEAAECDGPYSE